MGSFHCKAGKKIYQGLKKKSILQCSCLTMSKGQEPGPAISPARGHGQTEAQLTVNRAVDSAHSRVVLFFKVAA